MVLMTGQHEEDLRCRRVGHGGVIGDGGVAVALVSLLGGGFRPW